MSRLELSIRALGAAVGETIWIAAAVSVAAMLAAFPLALAWNASIASMFSQREMTWTNSFCMLVVSACLGAFFTKTGGKQS